MGLLSRLEPVPAAPPSAPARRVVHPSQVRAYNSAKGGRLTAGWAPSDTSADSELNTSLRALRTRSRALVRDAPYAKRAKTIVENNIVGAGIGMQAQVMTSRGELNDRVNDAIEAAWARWARAEFCHTGGQMHFPDLERAGVGQTFEAGEVIFRKYNAAFGGSGVPFALEMIEAERIADEVQPSAPSPTARVVMGVEVDAFHRPLNYLIRPAHRTDYPQAWTLDRIERVPASMIIHLRVVTRWPQTRGEPWMHAAARKLNDLDGYTESEIIAARAAASYMGFIESPEGGDTGFGAEQEDGSRVAELEPGIVEELGPGQNFSSFSPNRPNSGADAFLRYMLREIASGVNTGYAPLSGDYSQTNYSSSRLALLEDRDMWRMLQGWLIRNFREVVHREWLRQAVMARAIPEIDLAQYALNPGKFEAVHFKPRGWGWIDPQKEVAAFKEAEKAGYTTKTHVIAQTGDGRDIEDVFRERAREKKMAKKYGLTFDTDEGAQAAAGQGGAATPTNGQKPVTQSEVEDMLAEAVANGNGNGG